jgi:hypothetical protein
MQFPGPQYAGPAERESIKSWSKEDQPPSPAYGVNK